MTTIGDAAVERLEAYLASLRASYLDVVRDSLIGRLNEDPPLPASKVDRYYDNVREQGLDWPSTAPSMIGARRMENVRSECERVIEAGVPGDFMETGVWRGGACIMMRAVLRAYQILDRRVLAADTFAGFPRPSEGVSPDSGFEFHAYPDFAVSLEQVKAAFARYGLLDGQVVFLEGPVQDDAADGVRREAGRAQARRRHVREHNGRARQSLPQAFARRHADRRRLLFI